MNLIKALAPRLTYRVRYGYWCDHLDTRYMPLTDGMESVVWRGWSEWRMCDLGRDKYRECYRCGHGETLSGPPLRTALREWWASRMTWFWGLSDHQRNRITDLASIMFVAAFLAVLLFTSPLVQSMVGISVCVLVGTVSVWAYRRQGRRG